MHPVVGKNIKKMQPVADPTYIGYTQKMKDQRRKKSFISLRLKSIQGQVKLKLRKGNNKKFYLGFVKFWKSFTYKSVQGGGPEGRSGQNIQHTQLSILPASLHLPFFPQLLSVSFCSFQISLVPSGFCNPVGIGS